MLLLKAFNMQILLIPDIACIYVYVNPWYQPSKTTDIENMSG